MPCSPSSPWATCGPASSPTWRPARSPGICLPAVARRRYRLLVAFGAGGCETMILGQLLRDSWSETLRDIVLSDRPRLVLGTFRVPDRLPYPFLAYDPAELDPRLVVDTELP